MWFLEDKLCNQIIIYTTLKFEQIGNVKQISWRNQAN